MAGAAKGGTPGVVGRFLVYGTAGMALSALALSAMLAPRPANAKPEFAAQTGLPCGQCHVAQTGAGKLKPFGEAFKANGYKVPKK